MLYISLLGREEDACVTVQTEDSFPKLFFQPVVLRYQSQVIRLGGWQVPLFC